MSRLSRKRRQSNEPRTEQALRLKGKRMFWLCWVLPCGLWGFSRCAGAELSLRPETLASRQRIKPMTPALEKSCPTGPPEGVPGSIVRNCTPMDSNKTQLKGRDLSSFVGARISAPDPWTEGQQGAPPSHLSTPSCQLLQDRPGVRRKN